MSALKNRTGNFRSAIVFSEFDPNVTGIVKTEVTPAAKETVVEQSKAQEATKVVEGKGIVMDNTVAPDIVSKSTEALNAEVENTRVNLEKAKANGDTRKVARLEKKLARDIDKAKKGGVSTTTPSPVVNPTQKQQDNVNELAEKQELAIEEDNKTPKTIDPDHDIEGLESFAQFRRVKTDTPGQQQRWNQAEEMKWLEDNLPGVPAEVVENLKNVVANGVNAIGMFRNASIFIDSRAAEGTAKHEAYHALYRLFATPKEIAMLDAHSKQMFGEDKTPLQLEESMADLFMDSDNDLVNASIPKKVLNFFKKMWYAVRAMAKTNAKSFDEFSYRANNGFYKNHIVDNNIANKFTEPAYRVAINGWSNLQVKQAADVILDQVFGHEIDNVRAENAKLFSEFRDAVAERKKTGANNSIDKVADYSQLSDAELMTMLDKQEPGQLFDDALDSIYELIPEDKFELLEAQLYDANEDLNGPLYHATLERMAITKGVEVRSNKNDNIVENEMDNDLDSENATGENYSLKFNETSNKDNLRAEVRNMISSIEGSSKDNWLGIPTRVENESLINTLAVELSGLETVEDMILVLRQMTNMHPTLNKVIEKAESDQLFRTALHSSFSAQQAKYKNTMVGYDGEIKLTDPNRNDVGKTLTTEWKLNSAGTQASYFTKDSNGKSIPTNDGQIARDIETLESISDRFNSPDLTDADAAVLSEIIGRSGIVASPSAILTLNETRKLKSFINDFNNVQADIAKGFNPFFDSVINTHKSVASINNMSDAIAFSSKNLYTGSFQGATGVMKYSVIMNNYTSNLMSKLTDPKKLDDQLAQFFSDPINNSDGYMNTILRDLEMTMDDGVDLHDALDVHLSDGHTRKGRKAATPYSEMTAQDLLISAFALFHNNGSNHTYINGPVLADAPTRMLVKVKKRTGNELMDALLGLAQREFITRVAHSNPDNRGNISNFSGEQNGTTEHGYHLMPMFRQKNGEAPIKNIADSHKRINEYFDKEAHRLFESMVANEVVVMSDKDANIIDKATIPRDMNISNKAQLLAKLKEFAMQDHLTSAEFSLITVGDPAFYKANNAKGGDFNRDIDYYKRAKQIWSPRTNLHIGAQFVSKVTGETIEVPSSYMTAYLRDVEIEAPSIDTIKELLKDHPERDSILKSYGEGRVSHTDAQAYISMDMYRKTMIGDSKWNDSLEEAFHRLKAGKGTADDIASFMRPIKPFAFGQKLDKEIGADGRGRMVPHQHKNSEYILLPQLVDKNPKLKALYDALDSGEVDILHYDTAIKAGGKNIIEINPETGTFDVLANTDSIHEMDMRMRGIQQETPPHHISSSNKFGSQIRKIMMADNNMASDFKGIGIDGKMDGRSMARLYDETIEADVAESFDSIFDEFSTDGEIDVRKTSELIINAARQLGKGAEFEAALQYDPVHDRFAVPLNDPLVRHEVEKLVSSMMMNNIINQKISGASFVQLASFGLSKDLMIRKNDDGGIDHFEAFIPPTHKFMHDPKFQDADGNVDFELVNADPEFKKYLESMIGYRIPSELKYSAAPIKVIGFLPENAGGAIMLPAEITTISGSDFDVDKLYVMMKELENGKVAEYDYSKSAAENTTAARKNLKIDMMRSVLNHKDSVGDMLNPGGFERNRDIAKWVEGKKASKGGSADHVSFFSYSYKADATIRNMTGPQLVGVAALSNASHSGRQGYGMYYTKPMMFDGVSLSNISPVQAAAKWEVEGNKIVASKNIGKVSRNYSEFLAMVVDNAKDPLAAKMGYNMNTAGLFDAILSVGFDTTTATFFANHPVVKEAFARAEKDGGSTITSLQNMLGVDAEGAKGIESANLTTQYLYDSMTDTYDITNPDQRAVANSLHVILENAQELAAVISVTKTDSKGANGTTPFHYKYLSDKIADIKGREVPIIENASDYIDSSMTASFTKHGVTRPLNKIMKKLMPQTVGNFASIDSQISYMTAKKFLHPEGAAKIASQAQIALTGTHEFFNGLDPHKVVTKTPGFVLNFLKENPFLRDNNAFLNMLDFNPATGKGNNVVDVMGINTMGKLTPAQIDQAQIDFERLFEDPQTLELAETLVRYNYFTKGLDFGFGSFANLIPTSAKTKHIVREGKTLAEHNHDMNNSQLTTEQMNVLIDQIIRNSVADTKIVPYIMANQKKGELVKVQNESKLVLSPARAKELGALNKINGDEVYARFVSVKVKGKSKLMLFDGVDNTGSAIFSETHQLGLPGKAVEFDIYNQDLRSKFDSMRNGESADSYMGGFRKQAEAKSTSSKTEHSDEAGAAIASNIKNDDGSQHQLNEAGANIANQMSEDDGSQYPTPTAYDLAMIEMAEQQINDNSYEDSPGYAGALDQSSQLDAENYNQSGTPEVIDTPSEVADGNENKASEEMIAQANKELKRLPTKEQVKDKRKGCEG